eukprot:282899_1
MTSFVTELIIFGYIRQQKLESLINKIIPPEIPSLIATFYPIYIDFTTNVFNLTISEKLTITSWIRQQLFSANKPYRYTTEILTSTLLYDGIRDGFNYEVYNNQCDNEPNKFIIVETEYNNIFGCFLSVITNCTESRFYSDPKTFLCLIRSQFKGHKPKICKIKNIENKVEVSYYADELLGPVFGAAEVVLLSNNDNDNSSHFVNHDEGYFQNVHGNELCGGDKYLPESTFNSFEIKNIQTFRINID